MKDAWEQYFDLTDKFTWEFERRDDMHVKADGCRRCVVINGVQHNVNTVREWIQDLQVACDHVEEANPTWAAKAANHV